MKIITKKIKENNTNKLNNSNNIWILAPSDIGVLPDIGAPDIGKTPI